MENIKLYRNNKFVINVAHNPIQHNHTKDVEIDHDFVKEKLKNESLCMLYVSIGEQLADVHLGIA